jgi:glycosyltransferase involved in cell wall biosynthesis
MNLKNPFVTVVIPAYNAEKYISETLDSIFLQETTFPFLVHVFDDCSIDSTVQICQKYNEKYENFYLTIHPKNIGMSKNQHFAISNAQTKYVAYLDSDDLYCSTNFLQNQVDFLNENPTVSCVFCNVSSFDENLNTFFFKLKY